MITDDPGRDAYMRDMEHAEWITSRPICEVCGEPIQTEKAVKIDNRYICMGRIYEHTVFLED